MLKTRREEILVRTRFQIVLILIVLALVSFLSSMYSHVQTGDSNWWIWADGALQNLGTEFVGACLTFVLIEVFLGSNKQKEQLEAHRRKEYNDLLTRLKTGNSKTNGVIIKELIIKEFDLAGADLAGVDLQGLDLQNLNLKSANLCGANLNNAYLLGSNLHDAIFDKSTILPNGKRWIPAMGQNYLEAFTNRYHPNFWQPEWVKVYDE